MRNRWKLLLQVILAIVIMAFLVACGTPITTPTLSLSTSMPTLPSPTGTPVLVPTVISTPSPINGKFDAGGVNLYIQCMGQGSPTVVFDAGWGGDSFSWLKTMLDIRLHTRACVYDRASLGRSDSQTGLRTSQQMAEQLHTLLMNAGVEGPYLLVGHSLGGMNMLVFANHYESDVTGLVLVDSAHPDQADRELAVLPTPAPDESWALANLRKSIAWSNPEDTSFPEPMNWADTLAQVRGVKSLGDIPLAVLVAVDPEKQNWGDISPDLTASLNKVWLDLHKEYLRLSTNSTLILAEHSGHFIQDDEPQLVIDTILGLVDKARQK
jgi:pimeloyl-ACP methyl ester carboxylesterase